jgi:D-lactate dehydrogenase (cytochrome)
MNAPLPNEVLPLHERRPIPAAMLEALKARFGERISTAAAVREQHGRDESPFPVTPPDAVVFCESTDDVAAAVALAAAHAVPVIPFGVGSSLEGHLLAVQGGVSVDLSRMTQIVRLNPEDLTVTVQAGVTREQLNREIKDQGLFFPIDPGANATLGGMAATRASGTNAVRYGTMRENVLGLTVVTATGEVVRTGTRARKSSAGYDLTRLFVGSEGTLGVMTEVTLKLYPLPEAVSAAICHFPDVGAAVDTTIQVIQMGVPIARCELLDVNAVRAVNAQSKLGLREAPMLLMEFHGSAAGVAEQAGTVQAIASDFGGENFEWASTPEERTRLWTARHKAYFAGMQMNPGCRTVTTDTCVPISRLAEIIDASVAEADASGLPYYIVGHVGDGNFHLAYLVKEGDPAERALAERLSLQMVQRAIALEGTCTGEHGIGLHKMGFLVDEAGAGTVELMRSVKRAFDPKNIMNPGKIFDF